jgi:trafficking protein particle complex subunit 10
MFESIHILMQVAIPQILAAVHFRIVATGISTDSKSPNQLPPLYAGQPISALISIRTSFQWGTRRDSGRKSYEMRFDIEEMVRDWLISGRKRGDFEAEVCTHQSDQFWGS